MKRPHPPRQTLSDLLLALYGVAQLARPALDCWRCGRSLNCGEVLFKDRCPHCGAFPSDAPEDDLPF